MTSKGSPTKTKDFKLSTGTRVHVGSLRVHGIAALSPIARRISPMRMFRFASTTYVFGQIRACRSAFSTTFGRLSIKQADHGPHGLIGFGRPWKSFLQVLAHRAS